jgi:hypothetical protein
VVKSCRAQPLPSPRLRNMRTSVLSPRPHHRRGSASSLICLPEVQRRSALHSVVQTPLYRQPRRRLNAQPDVIQVTSILKRLPASNSGLITLNAPCRGADEALTCGEENIITSTVGEPSAAGQIGRAPRLWPQMPLGAMAIIGTAAANRYCLRALWPRVKAAGVRRVRGREW